MYPQTKCKKCNFLQPNPNYTDTEPKGPSPASQPPMSYADGPSQGDLDFLQEIYGVSTHKIIGSMQYTFCTF